MLACREKRMCFKRLLPGLCPGYVEGCLALWRLIDAVGSRNEPQLSPSVPIPERRGVSRGSVGEVESTRVAEI